MVKIGFHFEISDPVFGPCFVQFYPYWSKYSPFLSRNTLLRDTLLLECKCEPGFPTDTHLLTLSPVYPFIPNCVLFNRAIYRKFVNFYFYRISMSYESLINLATFSVDFCILYAECPPYFYFRFVWPTDLESIPHASTPTLIIPTKFEVNMTIHCRVTAFLSADTSRDLVTLTFDLLTLNSCHTWRVTRPTLPPSLKTLWLFVHE